uniref:Uncharacterized protein n=1 Tax=Quercus lobata TaxID=97700 RepID=A0A7N2M4E0_QUELO
MCCASIRLSLLESGKEWNLSVKSGYKLLCEEARMEEASGLSKQGLAVVRCVWCSDFNWVSELETAYGSFLDLVELCLAKPGVGELFGTMARFIWTHRNKVRLREK